MSHRAKLFASIFCRAVLLTGIICSLCWGQEQKPLQLFVEGQNPPPVSFAGDLPPGAMRDKATTACTECHEARIIVQQRLSKAAWTKEVDKMIKWGALVDANDHDALIDYLSTHFSPDQVPYVAPRTAEEKVGLRKSTK
jgi:hypothetical protein